MNSQKQIWIDTLPILIGQLIGALCICGIFILLRRFDLTVLLGCIVGTVLATTNYFLMYLFACKAAEKAQNQDIAGGQKMIQLSYMGRMIGLLVALILFAKSGWCNVITLALPLALNRPILTVNELIRKKGGADQ